MDALQGLKCAVIVAHPDDETLWAGGTILMNPVNDWTIVTLCRKSDPDRSRKFHTVLKALNARGQMGDLDDGPEQSPINPEQVDDAVLSVLPVTQFDLILTHSTQGEYTRHRRHEEVARAVVRLIHSQRIKTKKLWMFAYTDAGRTRLPAPIRNADIALTLPEGIWHRKHEIITAIYGFSEDSWEAETTPEQEAFWDVSTNGKS